MGKVIFQFNHVVFREDIYTKQRRAKRILYNDISGTNLNNNSFFFDLYGSYYGNLYGKYFYLQIIQTILRLCIIH
jgi:hypothetical protein